MSGIWPWLAVAGIGALHGLNPATGWGLIVAARLRADVRDRAGECARGREREPSTTRSDVVMRAGSGSGSGSRSCPVARADAVVSPRAGERARALGTLAPIALGHVAAVATVAALAALGLFAARGLLPWLAGGGALLAAAAHATHGLPARAHHAAAQAGLALWSLASGTLHGAGMLLVPALVPLCSSNSPAREITATGSLLLALAAVAVHLAAMLAVSTVTAAAARRGWDALWRRLHRGAAGRRAPPTACR